MKKLTCAKVPCLSCPYRTDVPSGVWHKSEYAKLPEYDDSTGDQLFTGAKALFFCHTTSDNLCAGWVSVHRETSVAMRLQAHRIAKAAWQYISPVPLFKSGTAAAKHGMRAIRRPGEKARAMQGKLLAKGKMLASPD